MVEAMLHTLSNWINRAIPCVVRFWNIALIATWFSLAMIMQFWVDPWPVGVFFYLGGALNLAALMLNNGFMPVRLKTIPRQGETLYKPIDSRTRAWFLGDWIRVGRYYASPGDLCLAAALAIYVVVALAEHLKIN